MSLHTEFSKITWEPHCMNDQMDECSSQYHQFESLFFVVVGVQFKQVVCFHRKSLLSFSSVNGQIVLSQFEMSCFFLLLLYDSGVALVYCLLDVNLQVKWKQEIVICTPYPSFQFRFAPNFFFPFLSLSDHWICDSFPFKICTTELFRHDRMERFT